MPEQENELTESSAENTRNLEGIWKWLCIVLSILGLLLVINQLFYLKIAGLMLYDNQYLYILLAIFLGMVFLHYPLKQGSKLCFSIDVFLFLLTLGICGYFCYKGYEIDRMGWGYIAPQHGIVMAVVLWALIVESVRRTTGRAMAIIVALFSLYPIIARYMPSIFAGPPRSFISTMLFHTLTLDSSLGIPMRVFATQLIGYMLFGAALQAVGGGQWFLDLAYSVLGRARGGPGKVAVLSSALFGSLSGSPISNVITTGTITIPAMKRNGFAPHTAGAIEACASTGGVLMPPVMGAVAFVMAAFLGMPYPSLVICAAIPSFLYYFGLMVQVDGYAANKGIAGLKKEEVPKLLPTLKEGWVYIIAMAALIYCLFVLRQVENAPFFAVLAMLIASMFDKKARLSLSEFLNFCGNTGKFLAELIAIMAGVGMIMGALTITGVASSLSRELVMLAGGNITLLLIMGALASFILGMGMSVTACYIFLAIVLAPALEALGFDPVATHLFLLYYGMLSYITPPVAMATYPAATLARTSPLLVGLEAARMAGVIYIIPFLFVVQPALLLRGSIGEVITAVVFTTIGAYVISSGACNYMWGIGKFEFFKNKLLNIIPRICLVASGILVALPNWQMKIIGFAILIAYLAVTLSLKRSGLKTVPKM